MPHSAKIIWKHLKNPNGDAREKTEAVEKKDGGFISKFRSVIRQIANISDHSNTEVQTETRLKNLKNQIGETGNEHLSRICRFFDDHRNEAMQYLMLQTENGGNAVAFSSL